MNLRHLYYNQIKNNCKFPDFIDLKVVRILTISLFFKSSIDKSNQNLLKFYEIK